MPVSAALRLNLQSAMRKMQNCFARSELEQCGLRNDLRIGPQRSRGVHSEPFLAQIPNPPTQAA
eukprot:11973259-Alexandrium_andersonii.AAC.1